MARALAIATSDERSDQPGTVPEECNFLRFRLGQVSEREPTELWGYPTQLDDLYHDEQTPVNKYGKDVWVIIANPSLYNYQTQMRLVRS